jgi:DNA-binding response OmpR family regulator
MKSALVAEDDFVMQGIYREWLNEIGFMSDIVSTGRKMLSLARNEPYDIIITDMRMPDWSGEEGVGLTKILGIKTPIICITGYIEDYDLDIPMFSKPIKQEKFNEIILEFCL